MNKLIKSSLTLASLALAPCVAAQSIDDTFFSYPTNPGMSTEVCTTPNSTEFSLWSPKAEAVKVNIYSTGRNGKAEESFEMRLDENTGTWHTDVKSNLEGKFYTFQIKSGGKWLDETPGIWAKAVGTNGERAAIIDFSKTDPDGWSEDRGPIVNSITDVVLYEMHHRDFSMHRNSGIVNKGKFIAMLESGTKSANGYHTGIDHLKELGITHVHILPSFDYNSVDETQLPSNTYNWGYDPINYNVPDGSYSTNPDCPYTRIREMKLMIQALHKAGIGVVMDVVYNHTASGDGSNFSLTAPGYFYRHRQDGSYSDASGCGNETASEREMMHDFIVNSVRYWAEEYHIDGFRFDLMAIHDIATMNDVAATLKKVNPSIFIYGEGWTAGDSPLPVERRALKENVAKMNGIAVFSDDIRDGIKGHYSKADDCGFATGKAGLEETVKKGIVAATAHPQVDYSKCNNSTFAYAKSPKEIINYVSCHDDLCLVDKLAASMPDASESERIRADKLSQTIVFTSQGTPFIFAGEEVFRSKQGVHNSYKSPDSINAIDWNLKGTYNDLFTYYKNLISLRKAHPAFRMTSAEDIAHHLVFDKADAPLLISYSLKGHANGDEWKEIKVIFNGDKRERKIKIPKGQWIIVAHDGKIDTNGLSSFKGGEITVPATSATIMYIK